ncbi:coiled-coil domain-containing protein 112-like [Ruditapes philippinarum]|uniref:coiled-coil domain-containing protein 112-like n=1 Tax=Ruditapes philippinarum TaxID=129788 RepID=UPI00295A7F1D|nr:coiled-coil domain-containing protein 112-like [Ruditapes philippinarum]
MATNVSRDEEKERAITSWRNKTEASKKGELLREIHKLKVQIQAMEREKCTHLYSKRSDFRHDYCQLDEMESKAIGERKSEQIKLKHQLEKISHMVKRFHKELRDVQPTPEFVERLKVIMEEIEGTINAFKDQQRKQYESMLLEERTSWLEIQALEKKFDSWSQIGNDSTLTKRNTSASKPLASARDITKDLPPEVAAFEKFVEQNGGVRGGWDEYDHQTFLKFRQRYQGKPVFLQHLLPALPTRTEEEINSHEEWYQEYLFLNETKKEAIKRWRERKEEEKEELLAKAGEEPEEKPDVKQEMLKAQIEKERMERKSHLNAYKVQKELERAQKEERKLREQLDEQKKKQEWKRRQEELKAKVMVHKKQREEEESYLEMQKKMWEEEEKERQKQISSREIAKFRQRDETALYQKLAKEKEKEEALKEKERRLAMLKSQVEVEVERDPNRLLKPTAGWKNRKKDKSSAGGQVLPNMMPHRAVPAWRQGP